MTDFIHQPHDKLFKLSMENILVARDFFKTHLPANLLAKADLKTLKLEKHSFIDEAYKGSEADILYSVRLEESLGYFYILCEHQSKVDRMISFRLLTYTVRAIETHIQQHPGNSLPVIYPVVVYTGESLWDAPLEIYPLFEKEEAFAREFLFKPYQLLDINRFSDEDLRRQQWSGITAFVLKYRQARDFEQYWDILFPWGCELALESPEGDKLFKIVLHYAFRDRQVGDIEAFKQKAQQYLPSNLGGEVMTLAEAFREEGRKETMTLAEAFREEGRKEIREETRDFLIKLLRLRFENIPDIYAEKIQLADSKALYAWTYKAMIAQTWEDVFGASNLASVTE